MTYLFDGFASPLRNLPVVNSGRAGRTFPIKWVLRDAQGVPVISPSAISSIGFVPAVCGAFSVDIEEAGTILATSSLTVDPLTGEWQYNWKTSTSQIGCWILEVRLADGSVRKAGFELR